MSESKERFGAQAAQAYRALLDTAFVDLRADPQRATVKLRDDVASGLHFYHLRHSRAHVGGSRVARPRHIVVFRDDGERLSIMRVLHDAMDIPARLADDA